jgi:hypothetical protein
MTVNMKNAEYKVAGGIITSPGKYQGEPAWVPYLDNQGADQDFYDGADTLYRAYKVSKIDKEYHPALRDVFAVVLHESDDGFVYARTFATAYELGTFINECELEAEAEDEPEDDGHD